MSGKLSKCLEKASLRANAVAGPWEKHRSSQTFRETRVEKWQDAEVWKCETSFTVWNLGSEGVGTGGQSQATGKLWTMFRNLAFIVRRMEAVDGYETEKRHDQVCLLGKPSTNIVTSGATTEKRWMQLGHSLEPWMQACGYVLWKEEGGSLGESRLLGFCSSPCTTPRPETFHTKKALQTTTRSLFLE